MITIRRKLVGWIEYPAELDDKVNKELPKIIGDFHKATQEKGFQLVALGLGYPETVRG